MSYQTTEVIEFDDVDRAIIEERNRDMKELETQLVMLAEIHNDMAFLVQQQGDELDTASKHIEIAEANTGDAANSLENAAVHIDNLRSKRWFAIGTTSAATVTVGGGILAFFHPFIGVPAIAVGVAGIIGVWKTRD